MKLKKRTAMIVSFTVGTLLFATTALAEIATKSGYDQAKDALKATSDSLTSKVSSYTMDLSFVVKDNGAVISSQNTVNKYDITKRAQENATTVLRGNNKVESLYYRDKDGDITYNSENDTYYVTNYNANDENFLRRDPFKEKEAQDIEKIVDALVGNLKDYVVVAENSDGSKELSGSLNESQIPALVNAIVSYQAKSVFGGYRYESNIMPRITQDVFIKEAKGKMVVDKNGLIQSVMGMGSLYGKDEQGKEHNITVEALGKVSNINSTVVKKPDLKGKTVEERVSEKPIGVGNPELYVGTYKNNIVIIKDNKFIKIGERVVDITQGNAEGISGSYREEYFKGYEEYSTGTKNFSFNAKFENGGYHATFDIPKESGMGQRGSIGLDPQRAKISFYPEVIRDSKLMIDGEFNRVFE